MVWQLITTFMTINRGVLFHRLIPYFLLLCFLVASAFIYLSSQTSTPAQAAWYNTGGTWLYRKPITIDHTKVSGVASSTLSSFPVLVSVTDTQLKSTSNGGLVASSTGADILFTKSDGTTLLDYEIESYASTTGQLIAWVNIPILSAVTDTTIYEYFGNASAPAETPGNITGTWDANYKGVWHLGNGTTLGLNDSTSDGYTLTNPASGVLATSTAGKISGAGYWPAGGQLQFSSSVGGINFGTVNTVSLWMDYRNAGAAIAVGGYSNSYALYISGPSGTDNLYYYTGGTYRGVTNTGGFTAGTLYYITVVRSGTSVSFYKNGIQLGTTQTLGDNYAETLNTFGNYYVGGYTYNGIMDEMRISTTARSADWIMTEYNNQSSPSRFYAYGALGANGRQSSSGAAVPAVRVRGGVKFH